MVTLASDLTLQSGQQFNVTSGGFNQGASFNLTAGPITIGAGGRVTNQGTGDLILGGNLSNNGTISLNGGGGGCTDADSILIRSNPDGTQLAWSGSCNFFLTDVDVKDQMAVPVIPVFEGTDSGNNVNFNFVSGCNPTAAPASITGQITSAEGTPLGGVLLTLSGGSRLRRAITDNFGNYSFTNVETDNFYSLAPLRANYVFAPGDRSFTLLANKTDAVFTGHGLPETENPLDTAEFFVRQQYLDFLGREPEEGGFNYWSEQLLGCSPDARCMNARRRDVAAAFFIEAESQRTGSFVYGLYKDGLGRQPLFAEFSADRVRVVEGPTLNETKQALAESFVQRPEFVAKYQAHNTAESFVAALLINVQRSTGVDLNGLRDLLIIRYRSGAQQTESRSFVVREVAENNALKQAEYNSAFVLMEYFGYLHRDPDQGGYHFWLELLNDREPNNYRAMVCAFITSSEYQRRFSSIVSHANSECAY